jgi:hypothetical protein
LHALPSHEFNLTIVANSALHEYENLQLAFLNAKYGRFSGCGDGLAAVTNSSAR